jgi:hypothetical protein
MPLFTPTRALPLKGEGECCMTNVATDLPLSALEREGRVESPPNQQSIDGRSPKEVDAHAARQDR